MSRSGASRRKRVLIFEPHASGHHGPYLEWMANGLIERGMAVTIVTLPDAMDHPSMRALSATAESSSTSGSMRVLSSFSRAFSAGLNKGTARVAAREMAYWSLFREWYLLHEKEASPDIVFLPYLDYCLYAIGLRGSPFKNCAWCGIAMRPAFYYQKVGIIAPKPALSFVKEALFFRTLKLRSLHRLLTVNEPLVEYVREKGGAKVDFFPEPASFAGLPSASDAKSRLRIAPDRLTLLVYGSITRRKGVSELLKAATDPSFPARVDVLLAGSVSSDVRSELESLPARGMIERGRLRVMDRIIGLDEEALLFAAADIVWVGYKGHYNSSGILTQAACARKPVIACAEGVIGWQTRRHHLGEVVDPRDATAVIKAVTCLANEGNSVVQAAREGDDRWNPPTISDAQDALFKVLG